MEFCRFRDFAVPLLGLSTRHPSIHEMRVTRLVDSSFRAPHLRTRRRNAFLLRGTILRSCSIQIRSSPGCWGRTMCSCGGRGSVARDTDSLCHPGEGTRRAGYSPNPRPDAPLSSLTMNAPNSASRKGYVDVTFRDASARDGSQSFERIATPHDGQIASSATAQS